jgi:hypothetical protein
MSDQEEMDKVLDDIEGKLPEETLPGEPEIKDEPLEEPEIKEEPEDKPPGYMGYEEWVAAGKDPKKFRGEEAYKDHYDSLQEIRSLKNSVTSIADGMASWKEAQRTQENERVAAAIADAKVQLAKAEEEEDVAAALKAEREITALSAKTKDADEPIHQPNPVLVEFQGKFPIIDPNSSQFDKEFHADMAMMQGTILDKLTGGMPEKIAALTPNQIQRSLDLAYREAKGLHQDKFTSPKNTRRSTPAAKKKASPAPDLKAKLKGLGANSMNPNDKDPATDIYNMLKEINPKKAEEFAAKLIGEA